MKAAYLDGSAAVKLVVDEVESDALRSWLCGRALTSSALLRVEVARALRPQGAVAVERALRLIRRVDLLHVSKLVLGRAADLEPAVYGGVLPRSPLRQPEPGDVRPRSALAAVCHIGGCLFVLP